MAWYVVAMRRLARGQDLPYDEGWLQILLEMYLEGVLKFLWSGCLNALVLMLKLNFVNVTIALVLIGYVVLEVNISRTF